jgi:hypothetical protein
MEHYVGRVNYDFFRHADIQRGFGREIQSAAEG